MVDRYTKIVLTVIALALCIIAWGNIRSSLPAHAQQTTCPRDNPCAVGLIGHTLTPASALPVYIVQRQ